MSLANKAVVAMAASAAALMLTPQIAEAGTVVASTGPSASTYSVGTQIGDNQRITLREGDSVTVLDSGRTRVFRGPGTFMLSQSSTRSGNRALAALTARRTSSRARTGAVRNPDAGTEVINPNVWYVDVAQSGTICVEDMSSVNLWRGNTNGAATYSVSLADAPENGVRASFPDREMLALWDSALQLRDGATYTIASESTGEETQVTFVLLSEVPEDSEELAQALIANGCTVQLEQIVTAAEQGS